MDGRDQIFLAGLDIRINLDTGGGTQNLMTKPGCEMRNGGPRHGSIVQRSICFLGLKSEDCKIGIVDGEATVADTAGGRFLHKKKRHTLPMICIARRILCGLARSM